jgi:hypothetical protein
LALFAAYLNAPKNLPYTEKQQEQAHWTVASTPVCYPISKRRVVFTFVLLPILMKRIGKVINIIPHFPSN